MIPKTRTQRLMLEFDKIINEPEKKSVLKKTAKPEDEAKVKEKPKAKRRVPINSGKSAEF